MTRYLTLFFLALIVVAALTPPTALQAQPFLHVENYYYDGCDNGVLVNVGFEATGCDPDSWGTLAGDWKERIITRCSDGSVVSHKYYQWACGSWVEVTYSQFGHGGCLC